MSASVLAEVRGLTGTNGSGMVDLLIQKKVLPEAELLSALSAEYGIPFWEALPTDHMKTDFTGRVSIHYLKKQKIVPLDTPQGFVLAMNDPSNFQAIDDLCRILEWSGAVVLSTDAAIQSAINFAYDLGRIPPRSFSRRWTGRPRTASSPRSRRRATCWTMRGTPP